MKSMKKFVENQDTLRIAIVALLIALNFGILTYYDNVKFSEINLDTILKVVADVFVGLNLFIFMIYIIKIIPL